MAEKIGLEAVLETSSFTSGTKTYLAGISRMDKATTGVVSNLTTQFVGLGQSLLKVGAIAGGAALAGIAALGVGLVAFGKSAVEEGAAYTKAMSNVAAISGATEEEFKSLSAAAEDLGRTTKFTAVEAAEGMSFLAMAGFEVNDIIGAMPGVLDLAAAGNLELGRSADIVSNILTGFGQDTNQTGRFVDVLTKTFVSSNTTLEQLGSAMKFVAPVAAGFGLSVEDVSAAVGTMSDAGIQATMAGTGLRTILLRLAAPTGKTAALIEKLGLEIFDTQGNMLPLPSIIGNINTALKGMSQEQRAVVLETLAGKRSISALSVLLEKGEDGLRAFGDELRNSGGTAAEIAAKQLDNLSGDVTLFQSALSGVKIDVFKALEPLLRSIVQAGKGLLETFGPQLITFFDLITSQMGMAITAGSAYIASLGGLETIMTNIGQTVGPIISEAFSFLVFTIFPALITAIQFVNQNWEAFRGVIIGIGIVLAGAAISAILAGIVTALTALLSPVGLIIAAAALLGAAWSTNFLGIRDVAATVISFLSGVFQVVFVWLSEQIPLALQSLQNIWTASWPIILGVLLTAWEVIQSIFMALQEAFFQVSTNLNEAFNILATTLSGLGITWSDVFNAILTATGVVFAIIGALILGLVAAFTSIIVALSEVVVFVTEMMQQLVMVSQLAITGIIQLFTGLGQIIKGIVTADFTLIVEGITNLFTGLIAALTGIFATIFTVIATPIGAIVVLISSFVQNIISFFETMFNALVGGSIIPDMVALIIQSFQSLLSPVQTVFTGIQTAIQGTVAGVQGFIGTLSGIVLPDALNPGSPTPFERGLQGIAKALKGPLTIAFKLFTEAAALSFGIVESQLASIRLTMEEIITVTIPEFMRAGEDLSNSFTQAASSILSSLNNVVLALEQVVSSVGGVVSALDEIPKTIDIIITISDVLQDIKDIGTAVGDIDDDVEVEIEIATTDLSISDVEDLLDLLGSFPSQVKTSIQISQKGKLPSPVFAPVVDDIAAQIPTISTITTTPAMAPSNQIINNVVQNFSINFEASEVAQTEAQSALLMRQEIQRQLANV